MQETKATIYHGGIMGVSKTEVRALEITIGKYAQYPNAVCVRFIAKGKRSVAGYWLTHAPHCVILEGHGHMEPDGMMEPLGEVRESNVIVTRARYASCDPRWQEDFDRQLAAYLAKTGAKVLHDFRGHNAHAAQAGA